MLKIQPPRWLPQLLADIGNGARTFAWLAVVWLSVLGVPTGILLAVFYARTRPFALVAVPAVLTALILFAHIGRTKRKGW